VKEMWDNFFEEFPADSKDVAAKYFSFEKEIG
jgi:hypothetical protein